MKAKLETHKEAITQGKWQWHSRKYGLMAVIGNKASYVHRLFKTDYEGDIIKDSLASEPLNKADMEAIADLPDIIDECLSLYEQNKVMREALKFYAEYGADCGQTAKKALSHIKEQEAND